MSLLPALACLVTARPSLPPPCHDALIPPNSPLPTRENIQKSTYLHTYPQTQPFSRSRKGQKFGGYRPTYIHSSRGTDRQTGAEEDGQAYRQARSPATRRTRRNERDGRTERVNKLETQLQFYIQTIPYKSDRSLLHS